MLEPIEDLSALLHAQQGQCAICRTDIDSETARIDREPQTGKFRGLLCADCLAALVYANHDASLLLAAGEFLQHFRIERREDTVYWPISEVGQEIAKNSRAPFAG
jgi:hypothetical protein